MVGNFLAEELGCQARCVLQNYWILFVFYSVEVCDLNASVHRFSLSNILDLRSSRTNVRSRLYTMQ